MVQSLPELPSMEGEDQPTIVEANFIEWKRKITHQVSHAIKITSARRTLCGDGKVGKLWIEDYRNSLRCPKCKAEVRKIKRLFSKNKKEDES